MPTDHGRELEALVAAAREEAGGEEAGWKLADVERGKPGDKENRKTSLSFCTLLLFFSSSVTLAFLLGWKLRAYVSSYHRADVGIRAWYLADRLLDETSLSPTELQAENYERRLSRLRRLSSRLQWDNCVGPMRRDQRSIAHRGAPLMFPEHTREGYISAVRMGAGEWGLVPCCPPLKCRRDAGVRCRVHARRSCRLSPFGM
eukprot:745729-Hanusia_phi.AAC.2